MPRSLRIVLIFSLFLLVLVEVESLKTEYPLKEFISHCMPHLVIVATSVIVGAVLLWIIEESIHAHITPAILSGLRSLSSDLSKEVSRFPERLPDGWKTIPDILTDLANRLETPEVKDLLSKGKISEAAKKAKPEEEIAVFIQSKDPKHWEMAAALLDKPENQDPKYFTTLAYLFWSGGNLQKAISIAERGLKVGLLRHEPYIWKLQNSLAYYYAETRDPKYEDLARQYIAAARQAEPTSRESLDTEGFVKITYGKTEQEIAEGISICEQAWHQGAPLDSYSKHLARANDRLKKLKGAG